MAEGAAPELRVLDGVSLVSPVRPGGAHATPSGLAITRAARLIIDRLAVEERRRMVAVVLCASGAAEQGAAAAKLAISALSLGAVLPLHVSGLGRCGLFTALHVGRAVLRSSPAGLVLVIRGGGGGCEGESSGALLLATEGGVACRPLPPGRVALPKAAEPEAQDLLYAPALALTLARGGVRREDVRRVACPGATHRQVARLMRLAGLQHAIVPSIDTHVARASTVEAAMAAAAHAPPGARTLLWARDPDGQLGACMLEPD